MQEYDSVRKHAKDGQHVDEDNNGAEGNASIEDGVVSIDSITTQEVTLDVPYFKYSHHVAALSIRMLMQLSYQLLYLMQDALWLVGSRYAAPWPSWYPVYYRIYDGDDDNDDDDDEYTNLCLSASCAFYAYTPRLSSPSPSLSVFHYTLIINLTLTH